MPVVRDSFGIIVQQPSLDGGDSAFTTGILAFSNSLLDRQLLSQFITIDYKLVRHPYQTTNTGTAPHNDPSSVSRDQVIAFFAGLYVEKDAIVSIAAEQYAAKWFVNKDFLAPANRVYLYKLASAEPPAYLYPLAYLNLVLHLIWAATIMPKDDELNQTALTCAVYGRSWLKLLLILRPDTYKNITEYFSGWRNKPEIGKLFVKKLKELAD